MRMHSGLDCGRGTEDDVVASMRQDMFTLCMGIIVLHWYHSPSMQLTTAMTALPPSPTARLVTYDAKCCGSSMCRAYGPPQIDQRLLKQPNKAGINRNGDNHHHRNCHVVTCDFFKRSTLSGKQIKVAYKRTDLNLADVFTKPCPRDVFQHLKDKLKGDDGWE